MTDVLQREEVTTSTMEQVLSLPFDQKMIEQVRRFGFEYEMFESDSDVYIDSDEVWSDDHSTCNCDECIEGRRAELREERSGESGSAELVALAHRAGLICDDYPHSYHCHCEICSHTRSDYLLTAQEDCSCGVEFVPHILDLSDFDQKSTEVHEWVQLMQRWQDDGGWMPNGYVANGNHVHVSSSGDTTSFDSTARRSAYLHIDALYAVFNWDQVADGGCGRIRTYNSKPGSGGGGNWLSDRGYGTFEHRVWNTPADPKRLWAHIGLSIALTRWGFAVATNLPDFNFWTQQQSWGNVGMSNETWRELERNLARVIDSVSQYIPDRPEFDGARVLIRNLR